jgi:ketosteroid isomerase-like protein
MAEDFDRAVATFRRAHGEFVKGDAGPVAELCSRRDDVTLANPLGPPHLGRADVEKAFTAAASLFTGGSVRYEDVSRYSTPDLGYVVQIERADLRLAGRTGTSRSTLRVTMVFRRESDGWRLVHRHADPIMSAQPISAVLDD